MRSPSSASSAAAISSASELPPSSSSQLDAPLDSLAASSSFSFLLWPLRGKHTRRETLVAHTLPGPAAASPHASGTARTAQAGHQGSLRLRQVTKYAGCVRAGEGGARSELGATAGAGQAAGKGGGDGRQQTGVCFTFRSIKSILS